MYYTRGETLASGDAGALRREVVKIRIRWIEGFSGLGDLFRRTAPIGQVPRWGVDRRCMVMRIQFAPRGRQNQDSVD